MKKVILIPDSFKGSLSSKEVINIMEQSILKNFPKCDIIKIPIADGGEGTVDFFLSVLDGEKISVLVQDPYGKIIPSFYGKLDNDIAIVELAACAGLSFVKNNPNPAITSTFGVGQLILHAIQSGAKKIYITLGGSATNDAGCGLVCALGVRFFDQFQHSFVPTGATLHLIQSINIDNVFPEIKNVSFITLCDVKNTFYGINGASNIFAKQKGADLKMINLLDQNMERYSNLLKKIFQFDTDFEGAGAAGGATVATKLFLQSDIQNGIDTFLELIHFEKSLEECDVVLTGEGKLDFQSFNGKVLSGILKYTYEKRIPLISLVGEIDEVSMKDYPLGLTTVFQINPDIITLEDAILQTPIHLKNTMDKICKSYLKNL
ncbi:MAG: glycerate kinase [Firmicutes bacterium]|nr:glycerate kinase [Bacillota bacterium]